MDEPRPKRLRVEDADESTGSEREITNAIPTLTSIALQNVLLLLKDHPTLLVDAILDDPVISGVMLERAAVHKGIAQRAVKTYTYQDARLCDQDLVEFQSDLLEASVWTLGKLPYQLKEAISLLHYEMYNPNTSFRTSLNALCAAQDRCTGRMNLHVDLADFDSNEGLIQAYDSIVKRGVEELLNNQFDEISDMKDDATSDWTHERISEVTGIAMDTTQLDAYHICLTNDWLSMQCDVERKNRIFLCRGGECWDARATSHRRLFMGARSLLSMGARTHKYGRTPRVRVFVCHAAPSEA